MTINTYKMHPAPSLSPGSKFRKSTWKLLGAAVYYGTLIQIGTVEAKAFLCRLCRDYRYFRNIKTGEFWLLLGGLVVLFSILNILLAAAVRRLVSTGKPVTSAKENLRYHGYSVAKVTRSGAVYGYM